MTPGSRLAGLVILVVEDEYLQAKDISDLLREEGASVLGPFGTVARGLEALANHPALDAAVLDVNVRGVMIFDLAELLGDRSVPYLFTTGYARCALPVRYRTVELCEKPYTVDQLINQVAGLLKAA